MRDIDGNAMIAIFFPFFPEGKTRRQLLAHNPIVQVKSCWNGMGINSLDYSDVSIVKRRSIPKRNIFTTISSNFKLIITSRRLSRRLRSMSNPRRHESPLVKFTDPTTSNLLKPPRPSILYKQRIQNSKLCYSNIHGTCCRTFCCMGL